jgi:rhodanese-related sulfurtransferase
MGGSLGLIEWQDAILSTRFDLIPFNLPLAPFAHTPQGILEREIEKLVAEPEGKIVVYCAGGVRSILAAENLQRMGYQNVVSMTGGIAEWQRAGLPMDLTTK